MTVPMRTVTLASAGVVFALASAASWGGLAIAGAFVTLFVTWVVVPLCTPQEPYAAVPRSAQDEDEGGEEDRPSYFNDDDPFNHRRSDMAPYGSIDRSPAHGDD